jgi:hypothetical protein
MLCCPWYQPRSFALPKRALAIAQPTPNSKGGVRIRRPRNSEPLETMTENNTPEKTADGGLSSTELFGLERFRLSQTARPMDVFAHWKREGHLELSPPYQRGDVWGMIRRRNLIRSIMMGIPIPSIIINDRFSANWGNEIAVIDGKQRITTILMFLEGRLKVPAAWFGIDGDEITYPELPIARQRGLKITPIPLCEGQLRTIEEEREVFELVNFGGVPQGESDSLPNDHGHLHAKGKL